MIGHSFALFHCRATRLRQNTKAEPIDHKSQVHGKGLEGHTSAAIFYCLLSLTREYPFCALIPEEANLFDFKAQDMILSNMKPTAHRPQQLALRQPDFLEATTCVRTKTKLLGIIPVEATSQYVSQ